MSRFNFADSYKAAGLTPGPDIISLRQKPFDKLLKNIDEKMVVDLTRLYFGLTNSHGTEWFREAFAETDSSFSMVHNEQEAAVLSACLLSAAINNSDAVAALAVLTTSAGGNRTPLVHPELIEEARVALINMAVDDRTNQDVSVKQFKLPAKTGFVDEVDALVVTPTWPATGELLKRVSDDGSKETKKLANHIDEILSPLANQLNDLREEVSMLWWHIGGWSRVLEKPFVDLEPELTAVMAGLDLADLSQTLSGPAAASAILHRTVLAGCNNKPSTVSIKDAVNAFPTENFKKLKLSEGLKDVSDICPVLAGFLKAHEIGESPAWENAFMKSVSLESSVTFNLLELAMQVYRERSLLSQIG